MDLIWASSIRDRVAGALEVDYHRRQRGEVFQSLWALMIGSSTSNYSELAQALCMSKAAIKMEVCRLRGTFRREFRKVVAHTVYDVRDLEAENQYLLSLLFCDSEVDIPTPGGRVAESGPQDNRT